MNKKTLEVIEQLVPLLQEEKRELDTAITFLLDMATRPSTTRPNAGNFIEAPATEGRTNRNLSSEIATLLKTSGPLSIPEITTSLVRGGFDFRGKIPHRSVATSLGRNRKFAKRNSKYVAKQRVMKHKRKGKRTKE